MKTIRLLGAAVICGAVRYPVEGDLVVSDDDAARIVENKQGEIIEIEDEEGSEIGRLTVPQLRELAASEGVDLREATKKADLIGLIIAHRASNLDA